MTIETLDPRFCVDFSSMQQVDFAIKENDFTAGFSLKDQDGINNIRDTWQVSFQQLGYVDMTDLWEFLQAKKGYISFYWTPPRDPGSARRWACLKLDRTMESSNSWTVQAVFQEVFTHHDNEVILTHPTGVAGVGHAGAVTCTFSFAPGTVGVGGVAGTASAGAIFPSQIYGYGEPVGSFQSIESTSYRASVYAPDGYIYVWHERKFIVKLDPATFKVVDVYDMDTNASAAGVHHSISGHAQLVNYPMIADSTYLYWATSTSLVRVLLSDFRTSNVITGMSPIAAMVSYNGFLYVSYNSAVAIGKIDLSNFTGGGVTNLSLSTLATGPEPLSHAGRNSAVLASHYMFVTFTNTHKILRIDLNVTFNISAVLLQTITNDNVSLGHTGRGAYDGTYIYYSCSLVAGWFARINLANTTYERFQVGELPNGPEDFGNVWAGTGVVLNGTDLWSVTTDQYGGAGAAIKVDLASDPTFAACTYTYYEIQSMNEGDSPDGGPLWRQFQGATYFVDQGYFDICTDGTWVYAPPNTTQYDTSYCRGILHRIQFNQTHTNWRAFPPPEWVDPSASSGGWVEDPWNGNDFAPSTAETHVDMPNWLSNAVVANQLHRKWFTTFMIKFTSAGGKVTAWDVGGNAAHMVVEQTNGKLYTAIWAMENPSVLGSKDMTFDTDTPMEYFEFQMYVYDGLPQHMVVNTQKAAATGTDISFTYSVKRDELGLFAVTLDQAWNENNWDFSDTGVGNWGREDWDTWGPEAAYGGDTVAMWVGVDDNTFFSAVDDAGTFDFNWTADTLGAVPYAWVYATFTQTSSDPTPPDIQKYVKGVWAVGYPGMIPDNG